MTAPNRPETPSRHRRTLYYAKVFAYVGGNAPPLQLKYACNLLVLLLEHPVKRKKSFFLRSKLRISHSGLGIVFAHVPSKNKGKRNHLGKSRKNIITKKSHIGEIRGSRFVKSNFRTLILSVSLLPANETALRSSEFALSPPRRNRVCRLVNSRMLREAKKTGIPWRLLINVPAYD